MHCALLSLVLLVRFLFGWPPTVSPQLYRRLRVGLDQVTNTDATGPITPKSPASTSLFLVGLFASAADYSPRCGGPG